MSEGEDVTYRDVTSTSFDGADIGAVQARPVRELLLRKACFETDTADVRCQDLLWIELLWIGRRQW